MVTRPTYLACVTAVVAIIGTTAGAQRPRDSIRVNINSTLAAQARISRDSAQRIALAKVPGAAVRSVELEREHGKLIYSFDLHVPGKSGVEEVNVNAKTGAIVAMVHESAKAERREAAQERRERKKKTTPTTRDSIGKPTS